MTVALFEADDGRGSLIVGEGCVSDSDYLRVLRAHFAKPPEVFRRYVYSLSDWTEVTRVEVSTPSIRRVVGWAAEVVAYCPQCAVAIAASGDLAFGLSRAWELWGGGRLWPMRIFRETPPAQQWIRAHCKATFGICDLTFKTDPPPSGGSVDWRPLT